MADNITVSIKVRPLIKREKDSRLTPQWRIRENTIAHVDGSGEPFVFDNIFDETVSTRELFDRVCRPILHSTLNGINGTIFAYGQTSSGKTHTMMGDDEIPGVVPLASREIFKEIENNKDRQFLIRVGYIEIYNEKIFDLLDKSNVNLKIFENQCGDVSLNYKEVITNCPAQIMQYLEEGNKVKRIGDTNMNERSSRSHTIFRITIESRDIGRTQSDENDAVQISTLNLVDLAGSERADQTGATGSRLKEGSHINKSLLSLSCVIQKLSENADNLKYINYRDSKLTRILQASLGGNAVTSMICNITPAAFDESYYTLSFAMRAKTIKNKPKVNEVLSEAAMMKRLEREIKRLQEELKSEQSKNSKIKTLELQNAITMRANQIINSQTHIQFDKSRRRTWCPSGSGIPKPISFIEPDSRLMPPPPPFFSTVSTPSSNSGDDKSPTLRPELVNHNPEILARKVRSATPSRQFLAVERFNNSDEFIPGELADFGERSPQSMARDIHTPCALKSKRRSRRSSTGDSPADFVDFEKRCKELEQELRELQEFTNLEKNLDLADIKHQLSSREELRDNLKYKEERVDSLEERCKDFEVELHQKREQIFDMEKELIVARKEREAAVKDAEQCRNLQNSVQVEYEVFQQRAKNREKELVESLHEARTSTSVKGDSQKLLASARTELKQLEVHNYELQLQLEGCNVELEKLRKTGQEQVEKISKIKDTLAKDIGRRDATKLFRVVTKLRSVLADEDLLINTSIDTDELVDSMGDSSFSDSLDRQSPTKIVLTNDAGKTNVIYNNGDSQMLDMNIENGELRKKIKLLEQDVTEMKVLVKKYEIECGTLNEKEVQVEELSRKVDEREVQVNELTKQIELEQLKAHGVSKNLQEKKQELDKLTSEYDELSTQVMDNIQDIDNYKLQIESLEKKLQESTEMVTQLNLDLDLLRKSSADDIQSLIEKNKTVEDQFGETQVRIVALEEQNEVLKPFKLKHEKAVEEIERWKVVSSEYNDEIARLNLDLETVRKSSSDEIRALAEKNKTVEDQFGETRDRIVALEEENEISKSFKPKYEKAAEEIERLEVLSGEYIDELESMEIKLMELDELRDQHSQLEARFKVLMEAKVELEEKVQSLELAQEKQGKVETHFEEQQLKIQQLQEENHDLTVAVQELSAKIVALEEQMVKEDSATQLGNDSLNESIKLKLETSLEMIKEETDHLSEALPDLEQIENKVRGLEQERDRLSQELSDLQAENIDLLAKHEELAKEYLSCKANQESAIAELRKELEQIAKHDTELQERNLKQDSKLQLLSDNLKMMEEEKSNLLDQIKLTSVELKAALDGKNREQNLELEANLQQTLEELCALKEEKLLLNQQIDSLKEEQHATLEEKKKIDEKCENLCTELSRLITEKEQTSESDRLALKNELNLLMQVKLDLEQETMSLKAQIGTLEATLTDATEQKNKLLTKLQSLEGEMEESSNIREHLDREVRALKTDLGNLEEQLKEYNEKVECYQKQNSQYQQELNEKKDSIERSSKERNKLRNSIVQLEQKMALMQEETADQATRTNVELMEKLNVAVTLKEGQAIVLDALEKEKESLLEQIQQASDERASLEELMIEKDTRLELVGRQVNSLENQIADLKLEIEQTELNRSEVEKLREDLEQEVGVLKKSLEEKEADCTEKTFEIEDLKQNISELRINVEDLREKLAGEQSEKAIEVGDLKRNITELHSNVEDLQEKLSEKEQRLSVKEADESTEKEVFTKQVAELTEKLENERGHHETSLKAEKEHSNELQRRINEIVQTKLDLEEELCGLQQNHGALLESHAKLTDTNQQLVQSNIQLEAQLVNLRSELVIREDKLSNVTQELAAKLVEFDDLQNKYGSKSSEMEMVITKKMHVTNEMAQQIKELEQGKNHLREQLKEEKSKLLNLSENQVPSLKSTIQQLSESQADLKTKLVSSAEEISRKSLEVQRLTDLCQHEKVTNERLAQQLEEAKLLPALQPDGRPSLGDGKVAQALRKENEDLLKQLNELQKVHVFKTKQLQDKIDELKQIEVEYGKLREEASTMRHDSSFQEKETQIVELTEKITHYELVYEETNTKHRSLQRQNDELRVRHQNLVMEMDDLRRIADKDRKSRRQSTHDDRRGVLFNTRDSSTMTDPSSTDCSCLEMDSQIKNLKKQLTIKDCQLNTQKMMAAANPLKNDVIELRTLVKDRESEILKLQDEIRTLSITLDQEQKQADKRCNNCMRQQRMRSLRSDKAVATDREDFEASKVSANGVLLQNQTKKLEENQEELRKLSEKYQQMKRLCRIRNETIVSLNQDIVEKENESCNANKSVQQEVYQLKRLLKESEDKFSQIQRMYQTKCGTPKVERTVQTEPPKNDELEMLRVKYEKYKTMAIALVEQNEDLKRKLPPT